MKTTVAGLFALCYCVHSADILTHTPLLPKDVEPSTTFLEGETKFSPPQPEQKLHPCQMDLKTLCGVELPNSYEEILDARMCLHSNENSIQQSCKSYVLEQAPSIVEPCYEGIIKFCPSVVPGSGALHNCLMKNLDDQTVRCANALFADEREVDEDDFSVMVVIPSSTSTSNNMFQMFFDLFSSIFNDVENGEEKSGINMNRFSRGEKNTGAALAEPTEAYYYSYGGYYDGSYYGYGYYNYDDTYYASVVPPAPGALSVPGNSEGSLPLRLELERGRGGISLRGAPTLGTRGPALGTSSGYRQGNNQADDVTQEESGITDPSPFPSFLGQLFESLSVLSLPLPQPCAAMASFFQTNSPDADVLFSAESVPAVVEEGEIRTEKKTAPERPSLNDPRQRQRAPPRAPLPVPVPLPVETPEPSEEDARRPSPGSGPADPFQQMAAFVKGKVSAVASAIMREPVVAA